MAFSLLGNVDPIQTVISIVLLLAFFMFLPRMMFMSSMSRINVSLAKLGKFAVESEDLFLGEFKKRERKNAKKFLDRMKELKIVPPTVLDPAGVVRKLEHILDTTEDKMRAFVDTIAPKYDEEKKANLFMAYIGVYGAHQIYLIVRHLKYVIGKTKNFQLGAAIQMFLPLYEEMAESQKAATDAFVRGLPIGDAVGPMVAAMFMTKEPEELAQNIVVAKSKFEGKNLFIMKAKGPGARLGKYGDAINRVMEKNKIDKIITIDAGLRFEGEETGKIVEGIGVLMGGPGVEKTKIEDIAVKKNVPLEGLVVKMSAPQASSIMRREIYRGGIEAYRRVVENLKTDSKSKNVLIVGVGNCSGIGNVKDDLKSLPRKMTKYWKEQKKEEVSSFGLAGAFPIGGGGSAAAYYALFTSLGRSLYAQENN